MLTFFRMPLTYLLYSLFFLPDRGSSYGSHNAFACCIYLVSPSVQSMTPLTTASHLSSWWMNPLSLGQLFCRMSHILDLSDICLIVLPKSVWILSLSKKWAEARVGGLIILCPFCLQDPVTEYFKIRKAAQLLHSSLWC